MSTEQKRKKHTFSADPRIISASRRTDIPAFYSDWFMRRIEREVVAVPNPNNAHQVSWWSLAPASVKAFVFWTKDARPMFPHLDQLDSLGHNYYFQYTLNEYPRWLEPRTPHGDEALEAFRNLSRRLGPHRVVWRYDPIFFTADTDAAWHARNHRRIAEALDGYTEKCVISFLDVFRKTAGNLGSACESQGLGGFEGAVDSFTPEMRAFGDEIGENAESHGMRVATCAEAADVVSQLGPHVNQGKCIDPLLLARLEVTALEKKDTGQREACDCIASREIGMYDSCLHGCAYCYATASTDRAHRNARDKHFPESATLLGWTSDDECPPPQMVLTE